MADTNKFSWSNMFSNLGQSSLGSVASNGINSIFGAFNSAIQYRNQSKLMDKQYKLNQKSLYESPTAMIQGYKAAGLNPAALNGQFQTAPTVNGGSASMPNTDGKSVDLAAFAQMLAQTDLTKAQTKWYDAEAQSRINENNANAAKANQDAALAAQQAITEGKKWSLMDAQTQQYLASAYNLNESAYDLIATRDARLEGMLAKAYSDSATGDKSKQEIDIMVSKLPMELKAMAANAFAANANGQLSYAKCEEVVHNVTLIDSNVQKAAAEIGVSEQNALYIAEQTALCKTEKERQEYLNKVQNAIDPKYRAIKEDVFSYLNTAANCVGAVKGLGFAPTKSISNSTSTNTTTINNTGSPIITSSPMPADKAKILHRSDGNDLLIPSYLSTISQ